MKKEIIITFDLEEWFHLCLDDDNPDSWVSYENRFEENMNFILESLDHHDTKATFLVLGWIAKKYPKIIRMLHDEGHDIGSHSDSHQLIFNQSKKEFEQDLITSIKSLEDIIGDKVSIYRAPAFSINNETKWALETIAANGIKYDLSLFQGNHSLGGIRTEFIDEPFFIETPSGKLLEYPISITNLLGISFASCGGGYFRLLPFFLISRLLQTRSYNMTYFHPRDFDNEQPRINMPFLRYFKTYVGLSKSRRKLDKLLSAFHPLSLSEDIARRDFTDSRIIDLGTLGK